MPITGVTRAPVDDLVVVPDVPEPSVSRKHWIEDWRPEDPEFWASTGEPVARRNLAFSIFSEHIGFSIWTLWSVFVLFLGPSYGFDPAQKFLLTTVPAGVGSFLRLPYTFAVAKFGGRNWTIVSSSLLLLPCIAALFVFQPGVSFSTMLLVAALAGVGGGNFSSSMSNIDSFYPQHRKGWALGLNAGGGNLGVAVVQLMGLLVLATAGSQHPRLLLAIYIPLVVLATFFATRYMDNLAHTTNEKRAMRDVCRDGHTWVMSFLYIGTFGSFIGFGFAFGQVLLVQFKGTFDTPVKAAYLTFLGPLLGSLIRPIGGRLADRFSGSIVTLCTFAAMAASAGVVLYASKTASLALFIAGFVALFVFSGIGNGSTYKMIPAIFSAKARFAIEEGADPFAEDRAARRLSRALIGIAGAVGAFGGVLVNLAFRQSFLSTHNGDAAYLGFICFYVSCLVVTWGVYRRPGRRRLAGV
ncbi:MAG TPA: nitrate/nitrite transporter [Acidimicrobiales bacterium]|nr:nitrate/nitrite transporter [Acidimicrobiales bacterium]